MQLQAQVGVGAYLSLEEQLNRDAKPRKRRRGRTYVFEDGEWKMASKLRNGDQLPNPSEDRSTLLRQLEETQKAQNLLPFLEAAVHSPALDQYVAARALCLLSMQRPSLSSDELTRLTSQPGLMALVTKMVELLTRDESESSNSGLGPRWSALVLQALAVYKDVPVLHKLVVPVAEEAAIAAADMNNQQVALCVWAVAELKELSRLLQDNLLPLMVQNNRILGVRAYLKVKAPFEHSLLKQAILKLRRDVPYLRDFLPVH